MELLITLGHNASAIGIKDNEIIAAYEEERLTGIKSCSLFAENSIRKIFELSPPNPDKDNTIYVSHWFDNFLFYQKYNETINKYYNYGFINEIKEKYNFKLEILNEDFTHHDAHAWSAVSYYVSHNGREDATVIVADGFGNNQEVLSVYELSFNGGKKKTLMKDFNSSGYFKSLGLMYQYATSFCGMKENQDEYKFLGYESDIDSVCSDEDIDKLNMIAKSVIKTMFDLLMYESNSGNHSSDYINIDELQQTKEVWYQDFENMVECLDVRMDENIKRIVVGYYIQKIIEGVHVLIIEKFNIKNVILTGGIYYNVKLNNKIMNEIEGDICICPVCGDQGAAIGLYEFQKNNFPFDSLLWGKRDEITDITVDYPDYIKCVGNQDEMVDGVVEKLMDDKIVNIVFGNMEFGPRALCHTSTLALPTKKNVEYINHLNKRNTVMPMAPCILYEYIDHFFKAEQFTRVIGSDQYMILTYDYKIDYCEEYGGIMHKYPLINKYSGRPQIVVDRDSTIYKILKRMEDKTKALINTSFNIHGKPIVFTVDQAMEDFFFQFERADKNVYLFIGAYSE